MYIDVFARMFETLRSIARLNAEIRKQISCQQRSFCMYSDPSWRCQSWLSSILCYLLLLTNCLFAVCPKPFPPSICSSSLCWLRVVFLSFLLSTYPVSFNISEHSFLLTCTRIFNCFSFNWLWDKRFKGNILPDIFWKV